ncbi:MAG: PD-(D/E)XK nuclease family protein [Treponematales bacterium]
MNAVIAAISRELPRREVSFVFPSEAAADGWARKIGVFTGVRSLERGRFLAWDRFKEKAVERGRGDRRAVSDALRRLFAQALLARNRERPFLRSIVPREFAGEGAVFAASIVKALPGLAFYRERRGQSPAYSADSADGDWEIIHREYAEFLARHGLFEPSWEKAAIRGGGEYVIFFPEAIEDYDEYRPLLKPPEIRAVSVSDLGGESPALLFYPSARGELRSAARELVRLHEEEDVPWEEMAVSVPGLEDAEPYVLRELALCGIPCARRAGKMLGEYGPGRLFTLIADCVSGGFSFTPLKALLLNNRVPWKDRDRNKRLVEYGIDNNCVSPYTEGTRTIDIWEEAFRQNRSAELESQYREIKTCCKKLCEAESFAEIRRRYFVLRGSLLETEALSQEENAALGRCVDELTSLVQIEDEYRIAVESPFAFFVSHLAKTNYVPAGQAPGVNIFPYRVAAGAPFMAHFVLNCSQHQAAVVHRSLAFLRQDKREALGLADRDASAAFFRLYALPAGKGFSPRTRLSASERSFSRWAIPHSFFAGRIKDGPAPPGDPFTQEKRYWAEGAPFPSRLFPVQKRGFLNWSGVLMAGAKSGFAFRNAPVPRDTQIAHLLRGKIAAKKDTHEESFTVTATKDLNPFFACRLQWLFSRVFSLEEFSLDARLLDDVSLGILYHNILKTLFARIAESGGVFRAANLGEYQQWAGEICFQAARDFPAFRGPLALPLLSAQAAGLAQKVRGLLKTEARYFDGWTIAALETPLEHASGGVLFRGTIDRVSVSPAGECVIIDYKTGACPAREKCFEKPGSPLEDFQMPMYVKLWEEAAKRTVDGAFFFSVNRREVTVIIGELPGKRNKAAREDYQPTLDALEARIGEFARAVDGLDFSMKETPFDTCVECAYKTICRGSYSLNRGERG